MDCLIMAYGQDFEPMAEILFWFLRNFEMSVQVLAKCDCLNSCSDSVTSEQLLLQTSSEQYTFYNFATRAIAWLLYGT